MEQVRWRVGWAPAKLDQAEAGGQTMTSALAGGLGSSELDQADHATQGELVTLHTDRERMQPGAGAEWGKVCNVLMLMCMGCHGDYVGSELMGREAA